MSRPPFINGHIYHICNRGVEGRNIFRDDNDRFRFIHDLFEFNDTENAPNFRYKFHEIRSHEIRKRPRKLLVHVLAFCLMPNHFHLLLEQKQDNGVSKFLRKLGVGYAMYFNQKYKRLGVLFQGRFKAIMVERDAHFIHLPYYIHANPLDLIAPAWREGKVPNSKKAMEFLENYRWSSFLDYTEKENFPSVTQREFLLNVSGGTRYYKTNFQQWLKSMDEGSIGNVAFE